MDIGLGLAVRNHPDRPEALPAVYRDYLDDAVYAEELGFDSVWVGEHRMTPDQWTPSPLVTLGAIAARTSTIRLGTGVLCLPFHNPLRVAEGFAVLDNISNGRAPADFDAINMQNVCIAATHDRAVEASLEGLRYAINFYALRRDLKGNEPDPRTAEVTREHIASR